MSAGAPLAAILLLVVEAAVAAAPPGIPPPILDLDTLCAELGSWQSKLTDRALGPAGRASAASTAWIVPVGERLGLGPRQVQRYIAELEEAGLVRRIERRAAHRGKLTNEIARIIDYCGK